MSIKVIVNGAQGKMGKAAVQAIENDADLTCVAECDLGSDLLEIIQEESPDVVLDFTNPKSVYENGAEMICSTAFNLFILTSLSFMPY